MGRYLFVVWQSGGGTQPMFGAARLLVGRGHAVDVLAPAIHRARALAAGACWLPLPPDCEFDPAHGRALEDQPEFVHTVLFGPSPARALLDVIEARPPDVVVVDQQMRTTLVAAARSGRPFVVFAHTAHRFHGRLDPEWASESARLVNESLEALGLGSVSGTDGNLGLELMRPAQLVLVSMPREFDPWPDSPANVVHAGPLFEEGDSELVWQSPWAAPDPRPLVVVALSSQYMHQEHLLQRILDALRELHVRVLVTTGHELAPHEIELPPGAVACKYLPHRAVLPEASLVVTHAGMGTVLAAFACGTPLVCVPLGRDQSGNAQRVANLGAGLALSPDATSGAIGAAVGRAIASDELRSGARRLRDVVASYDRGARAVEALERLLPTG